MLEKFAELVRLDHKKGSMIMKIAFNFKYFMACMVTLATIITIAIFIKVEFVRHHFGDILIVLFIYYFIRIFLRNRIKFLWLNIFAFAVLVEAMQYWGLVYKLGLGDSRLARVIIGVTFDW